MRFAGVLTAMAMLLVAISTVRPRSWAVVAAVPAIALPGIWSLVSTLAKATTERGPSAEGPISLAQGAATTILYWFTADTWPRRPLIAMGLLALASVGLLALASWRSLPTAAKGIFAVAAMYLVLLYSVRVMVAMDVLTDRLLIPLVPLLAVAVSTTVKSQLGTALWSRIAVGSLAAGLLAASVGSVFFSRVEIPYEVAWRDLEPACSYGSDALLMSNASDHLSWVCGFQVDHSPRRT